MGEHAVVYGKPAILAAINLRMCISIRHQTRQKHHVHKKQMDIEILSQEPINDAQYAVRLLLEQLSVNDYQPFSISISSQIPAGYHLGSSAALAVGLSGVMLYYFKKVWNPIRINELAYEIEKKQHGNPSGGDNTAVTTGGFLWFRKELEFLKSMWQLPFKPQSSLNHFFLINTGKPIETTGEMVTYVKEKMKKEKIKMEKLLALNEQQTKRIVLALKEGNEEELLDAIHIGEQTLEGFGVVSKTIQPLMRAIEKTGGAAKILGGGGRKAGVGFILCYHHTPKDIEYMCRPYGYSLKHITLGEEGVRLESKY